MGWLRENKSVVRRMLTVLALAGCCYFSAGYSWELNRLTGENGFTEYPENVTVDGADFTPLAEMAAAGLNGMMLFLTAGVCVLITTVFTLIIALLLRLTAGKNDEVTEEEVKFAKKAIVISSVSSAVLCAALSGADMLWVTLALCWQQPLFMLTVYYGKIKRLTENGR